MNVVGGRISKKPHYGIEEACRRWEISAADLAGFVIEREIVLSVVVARLPVDVGTIEDMDGGDWFRIPEGRRHLTGAVDLLPIDAWHVLTAGSQTITSFRGEGDAYIDIADRGDEPGDMVIAREQLIVRHAELVRFEAAQDEGIASASGLATPATPPPAARGAAPRYDWDAFWAEALVSMFQDGPPATLAEYVRRMEAWFADRGEHPDSSTIKKKLSQPWRRIAPQLERRRA